MKIVKLITVVAALMVASAHADTKVGGFVDAQFHWVKDGGGNAFVVNDGAVYLNHDMGMCTATVDLPVSAATGANLLVGLTKPQAYVSHKYDNGVSWVLGQFDSPFSMEANDSKDFAMARMGIVKTALTPFVHAGTTIGYEMGSLKLNLIIANQRDNNIARSGNDGEYGVHVTGGFGDMSVAAGALMGKRTPTTGGDKETAYLIDANMKYAMGSLNIGAEFAMRKDPSVGTDSSMGIVGLLGYALTDTMGLDARFSYLSKAALASAPLAALDSAMEITVGPSFKMSKSMLCKVHYSLLSTTPTGGTGTSTHSGVISSVYSF